MRVWDYCPSCSPVLSTNITTIAFYSPRLRRNTGAFMMVMYFNSSTLAETIGLYFICHLANINLAPIPIVTLSSSHYNSWACTIWTQCTKIELRLLLVPDIAALISKNRMLSAKAAIYINMSAYCFLSKCMHKTSFKCRQRETVYGWLAVQFLGPYHPFARALWIRRMCSLWFAVV